MAAVKMPPRYRKNGAKAKGKRRRPITASLTREPLPGILGRMIPDLPTLTGGTGSWLLIALKAFAAMGFMTAADFVILYAC